MNNFNTMMGNNQGNGIYPKTSASYFSPSYGSSAPTNNVI